MLSRKSQQVHPGYISGRKYVFYEGSTSNTIVSAADRIFFHPFYLPFSLPITAGHARCTTGQAGSEMKAAIWSHSFVSARPVGAPILADNTGAATTASGADVTLAIGAMTLPAGWYWWGTKFTTSGTLPSMTSVAAVGTFSKLIGSSQSHQHNGLYYDDTYSNNMPTLAEGATFTAGFLSPPLVGLTAT